MFDRTARPLAARILSPVGAGPLASASPMAITVAGFAVGLLAAGAAAAGWWALAVVLWLVNRLVDGLDGAVARASGTSSDLGGYLDMCADVVVYAAIPLGVAIGHDQTTTWVAAAFLIASFYVNIVSWSYLSALLEKRHRGAGPGGEITSITMPRGLIEGFETIVWLTLVLALPRYAAWTMGLMAAAVAVSAVLHVVNGVRELRAAEVSVVSHAD